MKNVRLVLAILAIALSGSYARAGIFGHRRPQPSGGYYYYPQQSAVPAQQPSNVIQRPGTYVQPPVSQVQPPARYVQQPAPVYRSYSQQPRSNPFPFDSRADPRDWKEAHRGYGVKIRGW